MQARSRGTAWLGRAGWLVLGLLAFGSLFWDLPAPAPDAELRPPPAQLAGSSAPLASETVTTPEGRRLTLPDGAPPRITCAAAQQVALFMARELAAPPIAPTPREFARLWGGLMDPHGLWSAAPDSPIQNVLDLSSREMLSALHERALACTAADSAGRSLGGWIAELVPVYDAAFERARAQKSPAASALFELAAEPLFEDDPVTRPGRELARELGARIGAFAAGFPEQSELVEQARARFFPSDPQALAEIATLAALRAYVPLVDPHGDFAPPDEEWALYAGDSTLDAGSPLWGDVERTPLGARIVAGPAPPLELDDLVLAIDGFTLAGASVDQLEQAARAGGDHDQVDLLVLREGKLRQLKLTVPDELGPPGEGLRLERIRYGRDGKVVLRIVISDVSDGLGHDLEQVLTREAEGSSAVLLDLRGNGGGSLDAAVEALGLLLPGARLFPLIQRGLVTEVLQAPSPPHPYTGPLAALVDGDTASAAEMLAGAIQAYERGRLVGARSFGKGCVQEYFDDVAPSGVLRMTTLQFVMPDGRALQQIGLTPELKLALPPALEREADLARQPITYGGPDVRDRQIRPGPAWPRDSTAPGPCEDALVCTAISRLARSASEGASPPARREADAGRATKLRAGTR